MSAVAQFRPVTVKRAAELQARLLRLKPAASYLSLSPWSLRRLIQEGSIPVVMLGEGAPWLIDKNDLDAWIMRNKRTLD